eukprot:4518871-Prymnesium_polylepis.1
MADDDRFVLAGGERVLYCAHEAVRSPAECRTSRCAFSAARIAGPGHRGVVWMAMASAVE